LLRTVSHTKCIGGVTAPGVDPLPGVTVVDGLALPRIESEPR
jgi:hypothetical protein